MKTTLELPAARVPSQTLDRGNGGAPTWEYCFLLQDEWSHDADLKQLASAGWFVVSFRRRLDNQREYLLKRPRK